MKTAWVITATLIAGAAAAEPISLPSGQAVTLYDLIVEEETGFARFRFLAPAIAGQSPLAQELVFADMQALCDQVVLPALNEQGWQGAQIVITLSDREVAQGVSDPEAVQYFEGYSPSQGGCIWELF